MKKRNAHFLLTAAALAVAVADATTWDASASLGRFDENVALGLPQSGFPVDATNDAGERVAARLAIDSKLDTAVGLPDGKSILTYVGSLDGRPATVSRGDGQLLIDTDEPAEAVARFDAGVAARLPAHVPLSDATLATTGANARGDELVVREAFGGDIVFADGSHARMYDATWHGETVVATRSGDHLDITSLSSAGVDITGFTAGSNTVEHERLPAAGETDTAAAAPAQSSPARSSRTKRSDDDDLSPNRLTFHIMLHDDVAALTSQHIHAGYVAWWLADLQRNIVHGKKVDVLYSQQIPGITDVGYRYVGSLHDWSDLVEAYASEQHIPRTYKHKFMLIVKGIPEPERYGRSWQGGAEGIASISGRYPEVAHQLGHLLGAKHADAEVRFGRWWCETNMYTPSLLLRSNCYRYSTTNMRLIDDYIRTGGGYVAGSRWSEDR